MQKASRTRNPQRCRSSVVLHMGGALDGARRIRYENPRRSRAKGQHQCCGAWPLIGHCNRSRRLVPPTTQQSWADWFYPKGAAQGADRHRSQAIVICVLVGCAVGVFRWTVSGVNLDCHRHPRKRGTGKHQHCPRFNGSPGQVTAGTHASAGRKYGGRDRFSTRRRCCTRNPAV